MEYIIFMSLFLIVLVILYIIIDNNKVNVVKENIYIKDLPDEFENYTILQISDMHSKKNSKTLYKKINNCKYDMIAFTGDTIEKNDKKMLAFKELLDNIENKKTIIYVDGNNGPCSYDPDTLEISDFGNEINKLGCKVLNYDYYVEKGNSKICFSNFEAVTKVFCYSDEKFDYEDKIKEITEKSKEYVNIGIGHEPVNQVLIRYLSRKTIKGYNYSAVIVGHYHGGQFKFPLLGVLYVPARSKNASWMPNKSVIRGKYEYKYATQYVSSGLGSSKRIPFLNFRIFVTPQIDLLTFKKKTKIEESDEVPDITFKKNIVEI